MDNRTLTCEQLGGNCDFAASGSTLEEIQQKMFAHAAEVHPEMLRNMTAEQQAAMRTRMADLYSRK